MQFVSPTPTATTPGSGLADASGSAASRASGRSGAATDDFRQSEAAGHFQRHLKQEQRHDAGAEVISQSGFATPDAGTPVRPEKRFGGAALPLGGNSLPPGTLTAPAVPVLEFEMTGKLWRESADGPQMMAARTWPGWGGGVADDRIPGVELLRHGDPGFSAIADTTIAAGTPVVGGSGGAAAAGTPNGGPVLALAGSSAAGEAWPTRLAEQVAILSRSGAETQRVQIRLDPPYLGTIEVEILLRDGETQVYFGSNHAGVRDALESSLQQLRALLSSEGLELAHAEVGDGRADARDGDGGGEPSPEMASGPGTVTVVEQSAAVAWSGPPSAVDFYA